jgi:iron complex transport system substrate-binding protein
MTKRFLLTFLLLFILAACYNTQPAPEEEAESIPAATELPVESPTDTPEPTSEPEPTSGLTEEPMPDVIPPTENLTEGCVEEYSEGMDYFPQKAEVTHSNGFTIEYFDNYKIVTVNSPYPGAEEVASYLLVQCGTAVPEGFDQAIVIETPIDSFVAMSTTYLPHLPTLNAVDKLVGLDSLALASTPEVRQQIEAGNITEVGFGADVNVEQVLDLEPDLVMTYSSGSADFDAQPKLEEAGITVVVNSDYLDSSPLGQAEWIKFLAAFFNQEAAAENWYNDVVSQYEALAALAATGETRPTVLLNTPFEGTWYMAGGKSYIANLLADAGANYIWGDDPSDTTLFLDFETVYDRAQAADYWINLGFVNSLADLAATDERFADFAAYQSGNVYNNDAQTNEFGGNDYYESGAANPHLVLADLIKIFHPDLLPDHELVYYRAVE